MKKVMLVVAIMAFSVPAHAQLGGLGGALRKAQEQKQKIDDLTFSDAEERQIGEDVSAKIRQRFGVVQDPAVHKYVALAGTAIAKESDRPNLAWMFVVLDTDGVNAFASPGGIVHITRGALGLIRNEAELAGVLAHEIGHITRKHTINAIQKSKIVQLGTDKALSGRAAWLDAVANRAYEMVLENSFDRSDELDADRGSVELLQKIGYASASLGDFLVRLEERNKNQTERNGLFASHPETKERIEKIKQMASRSKNTALVEARYKANITYEPTSIAAIVAVPDGAAGLTDSSKQSGQASAKEETKTKGFGLGALKRTVAPEKESAQVSASGGVRGVGADRTAKGGDNPAVVKTSVSDAELATFRKGIA